MSMISLSPAILKTIFRHIQNLIEQFGIEYRMFQCTLQLWLVDSLLLGLCPFVIPCRQDNHFFLNSQGLLMFPLGDLITETLAQTFYLDDYLGFSFRLYTSCQIQKSYSLIIYFYQSYSMIIYFFISLSFSNN